MATGTVKWFNPTKGYGFIEPEGGDKDVFVHISAVQAAGMTTLEPDQKIEYELEDGKDGKVFIICFDQNKIVLVHENFFINKNIIRNQ